MQYEVLQYFSEASLLSFYGWWELGVCLFAFLGLMAIWYHIGRKQDDHGQVLLAASILCWSISGGIDTYYAGQDLDFIQSVLNTNGTMEASSYPSDDLRNGWRSILSLFNSLFILLALPWFKYIPERIKALITSKYWTIIVGLPFLFALLPMLSGMITSRSIAIVSELDVYYATLTLIFLG